ncbi:C40 family peptidase [Aetokthonos hydrillicola Thurmond2011]|jgi:cell wall-associated NlpC family hydrolase|uniref:C40 family peptidase n=1 Tax=Aetokthonos hydrillicola Thurmond2011 TaxID=2712845 RepID=A0AAP5M7G1_9CYAN|nr:C40 family peptidase [Aetokthonos hydrillicola]MBO3459829.1 C40 family peptidase [Aetokthonos hydrillicola CCALA 1050]MBW4584526.1 C40 family peptidase [Aetokthonos hydrillicola CCALA 1050]MDR9895070.1 C40 family peptidase [Aetokthonos hydrillicola Thurmond2011]
MSLNLNSTIHNPTSGEYECLAELNLYDSPNCDRLATQAATKRHLRITSSNVQTADATSIQVCLCEDDYPAWLSLSDFSLLQASSKPYQAKSFSEAEIQKLLPKVIDFTQKAMQKSNHYLWGGTIGPNYDCSGLMQTAFASVGIWLPRDAYQQEGFTQQVHIDQLLPGDLIFFGTSQKATHVGLYLGNNSYIHSSGKDIGRNGIGIDHLSEQGDEVSQSYYQQLRGAGRVVRSYEPGSAEDAKKI